MNPRPQRQRPGRSSPVGRAPLQPSPEQIKVGDQVAAPSPADSQTPEPRQSQTPAVPESGSAEIPKWQRMVRKEARLRADQADELARLCRRLAAQRNDRTERITDNTLIRVAIDKLLEHADQLAGDTETELRNSVTTGLRESQSSE